MQPQLDIPMRMVTSSNFQAAGIPDCCGAQGCSGTVRAPPGLQEQVSLSLAANQPKKGKTKLPKVTHKDWKEG